MSSYCDFMMITMLVDFPEIFGTNEYSGFDCSILTTMDPMNRLIDLNRCALDYRMYRFSFVTMHKTQKTTPEEKCQLWYGFGDVFAIRNFSKAISELWQTHLSVWGETQLVASWV